MTPTAPLPRARPQTALRGAAALLLLAAGASVCLAGCTRAVPSARPVGVLPSALAGAPALSPPTLQWNGVHLDIHGTAAITAPRPAGDSPSGHVDLVVRDSSGAVVELLPLAWEPAALSSDSPATSGYGMSYLYEPPPQATFDVAYHAEVHYASSAGDATAPAIESSAPPGRGVHLQTVRSKGQTRSQVGRPFTALGSSTPATTAVRR